eukprot:363563-Prorocentrum_minimum.AAC.1
MKWGALNGPELPKVPVLRASVSQHDATRCVSGRFLLKGNYSLRGLECTEVALRGRVAAIVFGWGGGVSSRRARE